MRETLPDDVGVSVSYPLPGTRFFDMVQTELGEKTHWQDSNDLRHDVPGHLSDAFLSQAAAARAPRSGAAAPSAFRRESRARDGPFADDWRELERLEPVSRSEVPTAVHKIYEELPVPDLSRTWN